jgi:hypothetical protein
MANEIEDTIAEALHELTAEVSGKPYEPGQYTYICDLMHHALHCWSCGWTGVIFEFASLENVAIGALFSSRTEALCPQCGTQASRVRQAKEEVTGDGRRGLKLV